MDTQAIIEQLKAERDRIDLAIRALQGVSGSDSVPNPRTAAVKKQSGGLTAAGRRRLSENMKKRWAERRKAAAGKATAAKAAKK